MCLLSKGVTREVDPSDCSLPRLLKRSHVATPRSNRGREMQPSLRGHMHGYKSYDYRKRGKGYRGATASVCHKGLLSSQNMVGVLEVQQQRNF